MTDQEVLKFLQDNVHLIIKLQNWVRGNKARKQVAFMKSKQIGSSRYFTFVEFKETVRSNLKTANSYINEPR